MLEPVVPVSESLLLHPELTATAKLLWMMVQLDESPSQVDLAAKLGVSRSSVVRGLRKLAQVGAQGGPARATMPADLLLDKDLSVQAKLLFAYLQLTPGCVEWNGNFTYASLCELTGLCRSTVQQALRDLSDEGWVIISQKHPYAPVRFTLRNRAAINRAIAVSEAAERLKEARYEGEALMREYLNLLVDSNNWEDGARPNFLENPFTGQNLEFDRFYPPSVAFEYNGPQHYRTTKKYANEAKVRNQIGRDLIKLGLCTRLGITLVVVHAEDLCFERMRGKVEGLLPLRPLTGQEPMITYLESLRPRNRALRSTSTQ